MKNKYILGFILGIFLIGLVSAGITGYAVRDLKLGDSLLKNFGENIAVGETTTNAEGNQVTITAVRKSLFRGTRVDVEVAPPVSGDAEKWYCLYNGQVADGKCPEGKGESFQGRLLPPVDGSISGLLEGKIGGRKVSLICNSITPDDGSLEKQWCSKQTGNCWDTLDDCEAAVEPDTDCYEKE